MTTIRERLDAVNAKLAAAARRVGRDPADVRVVAVSKTFPAARVLEAADAGAVAFGENRVQEAAAKIPEVRKHRPELEWHFVGALQRNKAARAVELFSVIHSVDRPALADALQRAASERGVRPRVLLQVDLDDEPQKGGVSPEALPALAQHVAGLPELELVGLMAIPKPRPEPETQRPAFARLRVLAGELTLEHPQVRELSMGMSGDFEVAIEEGATLVRVGTAIFGAREPAPQPPLHARRAR